MSFIKGSFMNTEGRYYATRREWSIDDVQWQIARALCDELDRINLSRGLKRQWQFPDSRAMLYNPVAGKTQIPFRTWLQDDCLVAILCEGHFSYYDLGTIAQAIMYVISEGMRLESDVAAGMGGSYGWKIDYPLPVEGVDLNITAIFHRFTPSSPSEE